ncbi:NADH-quinone oxidoreductase subunit G [Phaeovibrio sulfidiphilus]|uniref:NADH-quinone oxidoreductase n=1 Tax=Phaeovibrio sulfidiphilus TaxID=1220600 RepID=A0A8J7CPK1_9PROT|nr:NADH-quinone oxidoreductase subunit NuoG [Phaeovibrio sulfidiphilus]MBE1237082.1 NADH-quinone oxidoreductase subunit G [Phaeovibrio sulfidiphilus]
MPKLTIDGIPVEAPEGATVLQAAELAGIEIPRFCYHERLSIAGNCRMCLVEVKPGPPKPAASCALPVCEGMEVFTNSEMARAARKGTIEFMLVNHPLDCPICDQGGECDLQDETVLYGEAASRFREDKHAFADKDLGPLINTRFTRCIHCTRCVRFCDEIAGVPALGMIGRGSSCEIMPWEEGVLQTELAGNLVDVCPVGSLTNRPFAFRARSWELTKTDSIDIMDAMGSSVRIDSRSNEVLRILPRLNDAVNEEWIGDRSRHFIDGLLERRLDTPWARVTRGAALRSVSWEKALEILRERVEALGDAPKVGVIAGDQTDLETLTAAKDLCAALGSPNMDCRQDGARLDASVRAGYLFNATIEGLDQADAILLIGSDPRKEAPVLNARIFRRVRNGQAAVARIGVPTDLTYPVTELGNTPGEALAALRAGTHPFAEVLRSAKHPVIIVGQGALRREDGAAVLNAARDLADALGVVREGWNGFSVLHTAAGRVGGLDLGFVPGKDGLDAGAMVQALGSGSLDVLILLGADEFDTSALANRSTRDALVVYIGSHGDAGAAVADIVLPGSAWTEKTATWVSMEGRVQRTLRAVSAPGAAVEDWVAVARVARALGHALPFSSVEDVRARMAAINPLLGTLWTLTPAPWGAPFGTEGAVSAEPFTPAVPNYYMTCPISRASRTMAACVEALSGTEDERTGTDG